MLVIHRVLELHRNSYDVKVNLLCVAQGETKERLYPILFDIEYTRKGTHQKNAHAV